MTHNNNYNTGLSSNPFSLTTAFNLGYLSVPMLYLSPFAFSGQGQALSVYGQSDPGQRGYAQAYDILSHVLYKVRQSQSAYSGWYLNLAGPWDIGARSASIAVPMSYFTPPSAWPVRQRWPEPETRHQTRYDPPPRQERGCEQAPSQRQRRRPQHDWLRAVHSFSFWWA